MRDGPSFLLPSAVMRCYRLLEGEQPLIYQWLLRSGICRASATGASHQHQHQHHHLHDVRCRKRINRKSRRVKARIVSQILVEDPEGSVLIQALDSGLPPACSDLLAYSKDLDGKTLFIDITKGLVINSGNLPALDCAEYTQLLPGENPGQFRGYSHLDQACTVQSGLIITFESDNSQNVHFDELQHFQPEEVQSAQNGDTDEANHATEAEPADTSYLPGLDDSAALRCLAFLPVSHHWKLSLLSRRHRDLVSCRELMKLRWQYSIVEQWICIYTSGNNGWTAFDPKQNKWRNLPRANVDPNFDLSDKESLSAGTHLLWLGREAFTFACYKYDLFSNSWDRGPPMVTPRCLFASASCGEFAFVAGGFSMQLSVLNTAERYNSSKGEWEPLPPMSIPRHRSSGFFMDGKFYVIGGKTSNFEALTSGEEYDPEKNSWRTIDNMYSAPPSTPSFEPSPPLVAVAGNELYAIESSSNLLKAYNKVTNAWKVLGPVPVRADFCNGWGLAFKALGDELFVIGGHRISTQEPEGVAVFSWRPQPGAEAPEWQLVNSRVTGTGNFLFNCAVMGC